MLKGIPIKFVDFNTEISLNTASESVTKKFLSLQDTTKLPQTNTVQPQLSAKGQQVNPQKTTIAQPVNTTQKTVSPGLAKINQNFDIVQNVKSQPVKEVNPMDTSSMLIYSKPLPFEIKRTAQDELFNDNFLLTIPYKNISHQFDTASFTRNGKTKEIKSVKGKNELISTIIHKDPGFQGNFRNEASLDWIPAVLLISLFTFSWIKQAYQKYVVQVVASLVNYQASIRLLREKNVLFRNTAIGLNFVFSINIGLLIFYYLQYYNLNQITSSNFLSVVIYSVFIILLYNVKSVVCRIIGNVFLVKEEFAEYVHNIHLYNKNIGLFLFPVVILFPYITNNEIKPLILYAGLTIVVGMFLLLVYRGIQIIMRNGVSIFYLILYLCAVEILPILLLVKYSYTLI